MKTHISLQELKEWSDLLITALRNKFRYPTSQGLVTTEELWDIPVDSADPNEITLMQIRNALKQEDAQLYLDIEADIDMRCAQSAELQRKIQLVKLIILQLSMEDAEKKKSTDTVKSYQVQKEHLNFPYISKIGGIHG